MVKRNFAQHALEFVVIFAFVLGAAAFGANSHAAQATGMFGVTATVIATCTVSGSTLGFGSFNALGGDVDATSNLTATCTNGSAYTIGLNAGMGAGATVTARKMTHANGTNTLNYSLSPCRIWWHQLGPMSAGQAWLPARAMVQGKRLLFMAESPRGRPARSWELTVTPSPQPSTFNVTELKPAGAAMRATLFFLRACWRALGRRRARLP